MPHSYIFHGPDGIGKTLLARQWAKLLLCAKPTRRSWSWPGAPDLQEIDDCCDQCPSCRLVAAETHPDLHIINKELTVHTSQGRNRQVIALPIDVIREFVLDQSHRYPVQGRARVFIVEQADSMNRQAQNALLKTLEEPPVQTFLFLIGSQPHRFLPTVRSRCQAVRFLPLPRAFVHERLVAAGVVEPAAGYWADFSVGQLGQALQFAQLDLYPTKCALIEELTRLSYGCALQLAAHITEYAKSFAKNYRKLHPDQSEGLAMRLGHAFSLQVLCHSFSLALRFAAGGGPAPLDQPDCIEQIARKYGSFGCARAIGATSRAQRLLDANVNATLIFEWLMLLYITYACAGATSLIRAS